MCLYMPCNYAMWDRGAYYSNCAVIGHFTCQMATSLCWAGCRFVTRPFSYPRGWGLGMRLNFRRNINEANQETEVMIQVLMDQSVRTCWPLNKSIERLKHQYPGGIFVLSPVP